MEDEDVYEYLFRLIKPYVKEIQPFRYKPKKDGATLPAEFVTVSVINEGDKSNTFYDGDSIYYEWYVQIDYVCKDGKKLSPTKKKLKELFKSNNIRISGIRDNFDDSIKYNYFQMDIILQIEN